MAATLVDLRDAAVGYDGNVVLNVDLAINEGEFVAIVGPNGSGKSTLLKTIVGLLTPSTGSLELFGLPATRRQSRWRVGYVPQRQLVGGTVAASVREVVASGRLAKAGLLSVPRRRDREAVDAALAKVGMAAFHDRAITALSGGQQRRVLIARALATGAELLLLDEPTAGVDIEAQTSLIDVLGQLSRSGITIAVVTHDLEPFAAHLTRVVWVSHGRIEYDGPPTQAVLMATHEPFAHHDHDDEPHENFGRGV